MDADTIRQLRKFGFDDIADELDREEPTAEELAEVLHPWATVWMSDGHPSIIPRSTLTMATDLLEKYTILRSVDVPDQEPVVRDDLAPAGTGPDDEAAPRADHGPGEAHHDGEQDQGPAEPPAYEAARRPGDSPQHRDQARAQLINGLYQEWHEGFRHIITFGEFMVAQEQKGRA
jgi:hypothetical protein